MSMPQYPLVLAQSAADGATLTNSTAATSILHGSGKATIPPGSLQVGSKIRVRLRGRISTVVTTPGTLTFALVLAGVTISSLGAIALNTTAQTNATFEAEFDAVVRSLGTGTGATALVTGKFTSRANIGSPAVAAGAVATAMLPDTAPAVGSGFDSSAQALLDVLATWSVASASNSLTVHDSLVELKV